MLEIHCSGTPYEIGLTHGRAAKSKIHGSISCYTAYFAETAGLDWSRAKAIALQFEPSISSKWPSYLEEMRGIADGAGVSLACILALNVRTEIAIGLMRDDTPMDGCTTLWWRTERESWLARNWDWVVEQKNNLVNVTIEQTGKPAIKMITEAGIIGKIGLNEQGVGVALNAVRAKGIDASRLPVHLGLRMALESSSAKEAEKKIRGFGIASASSIGIADAQEGGFALECSCKGFGKVERNGEGRMFHSNHFLVKQEGVVDIRKPTDTLQRITRIEELTARIKGDVTFEKLLEVFKDEKGYPVSICRAVGGPGWGASIFNIIMELKSRRALVTLGRAIEPEETIWLEFQPNRCSDLIQNVG